MLDKKIIGLSILAIFLLGAVIITTNLTRKQTLTKTRATISQQTTVPSLILSPDETAVKSGGAFNVDVYLNTAGNKINGSTALLNFDPGLLSVVEVVAGNLKGMYPAKSADNQKGKITLGWVSFDTQNPKQSIPFSGTSLLGQIRFQAKNVSSDTKTAISFNFSPGITSDSNITNINGQDILSKVSTSIITIKP